MIISEQFDDIYFSRQDGLAEAHHVFLKGCNLPEAWMGCAQSPTPFFRIGELGFGTGLNMLATWKLFEETAPEGTRLELLSIEKYPLTKAKIAEALSVWQAELGEYLATLLENYPMRISGFHRINLSQRVSLTLVFDDVIEALNALSTPMDAWFLDGFAPAKNPDMWGDEVLALLARLSKPGTRLATFTAAGIVRRGLGAQGFEVQKTKGYGYKRDMLIAQMPASTQQAPCPSQTQSQPRIAVLGSGLAGASAAWHLKRAGLEVEVFEAASSVGAGASGNRLGLVNPKLTTARSPQTRFYTSAYSYALHLLKNLPDVEFSPHGSLHLELSDDKARRFSGYLANLGWEREHMQYLLADAASDVAKIPLTTPALFFPDAPSVSPKSVCQALLKGVVIHLDSNASAESLRHEFDIVIHATGAQTPQTILPIQRVRGQTTRLIPTKLSKNLAVNLCYGGYLSPYMPHQEAHMCGATFQPWSADEALSDDDNARNLSLLTEAVPALANEAFIVKDAWCAFRATTPQRFPVIGRVQNTWISTAHGSHGLSSALLGGAILASLITGGLSPVGQESVNALSPIGLKA